MRKDINMKYKRQGQIVRIIKEKPIKTHEQLIEELSKSGYMSEICLFIISTFLRHVNKTKLII